MNIPDTIRNLPNEEYHRGVPYNEYLSSTSLKDYIVSPKYAEYKRKNPELFEISKEASEKGSLYHSCLESIINTGDTKEFESSVFVFEPPVNDKTSKPYGYETKAYQDALSIEQGRNPGRQLVSRSDLDSVLRMIDELLYYCRQTSKDIKRLIKWGEAEVSHFVEYNGCKFKYRPDLETTKKIVDWKTVSADDLQEDTINKIILKFKYDISAAFYQFFEHERTGIWKDFYWVFQQKQPPYDAVLVSAENYGYFYDGETVRMGAGAHKFTALLNQHIYCVQNDEYDGAQIFIRPEFMKRRIMKPTVPGYETMKLLTYYND
ncbi:MAG: PD-(D/E)XK nuclease-like domain-containing protein [Candidatus Azobacteroides sp.]|nr:PD-(D/E)XK nuclease-like domain-containing protein [Candidatus Azobacteroides sp.]